MMREPRRRSPESSRRRRRERRDSREQLTSLPPMAISQGSYTDLPPAPAATTTTTTTDRERTRDRRPRAPSSSGSSSSSLSSTVLDISRHYPYSSRFGGVIGTFFRAPSERSRRRRERRRSGGTRRRRILYFGNSSSSSVNSDLAYGNGYINQPKGRNFSPRGTTATSTATATAAAAGQSLPYQQDHHQQQQYQQQYRGAAGYATDGSNRPGAPRRAKTDEEIIALGRQLSDFARKQNEHDLRAAGRSKSTGLMAAAATVSALRQRKRDGTTSRGIGSSRPHRGSSGDESDWESASDGESSDGANSELAYGSIVSHALPPALSAAAGGVAAAAAASSVGRRAAQTRQPSVVDPRLFGPVNSLRGLVTPRPFGDDDSTLPAVQYQDFNRLRRAETEPLHKTPAKDGYPVATSDSRRFDADAASLISSRQDLPHRSRPAPVPLQQPVPKTPVSAKVYQAEKLEDASLRDSRLSRQRSEDDGFSGATLAGVAAAAAGAAALASERKKRRDERKDERKDQRKDERKDERRDERRDERKDERKDERRDERRDARKDERRDEKKDSKKVDSKKDRRESREYRDYRDDERRDRDRRSEKSEKSEKGSKRPDRESDRDKEGRISKRDSYSSKYPDDKDDSKRSSRRDDQDPPRKRRETFVDHNPEQETCKYRNGEIEVQVGPEARSEVSKYSRTDSRKYDVRDEQREPRKPGEKAVSERSVETTKPPLADPAIDPFQYQVGDNTLMAAAPAAPDRPLTPQVFTVERVPNFDDSPPAMSKPDSRLSRKDSFEMERRAEEYKNGPQGAARSAEPRRRHSYEEDGHEAQLIYDEARHATIPVGAAVVASAIAVEALRSRDRQREEYSDDGSRERRRDAVLEEANRHYREAAIARKIAEDQVRSRSQTPDRSVVDKWDEDGTNGTAHIVTPPELDDQYHDKGKNIYEGPDADVRIDNKIYPTEIYKFRANGRGLDQPVFKSRDPSCERDRPLLNLVYPTPLPSRHATPSPEQARRSGETRERGEPSSQAESSEVASGSSTAKSVTWGQNSTKRFEVETPEPRSDTEGILDNVESGDQPRPRLDKSSQWGIIAAAIAGSSAEPANEPEARDSRKTSESISRDVTATRPDPAFTYDSSDVPPVPGPKPASPQPEQQMPGSFGDDIEFAATLAAGLKDSGFDPNIVIDDPTYRRRDSPPGSSEPSGDGWNRKSFADIATDFSSAQRSVPQPGYVVGEVETPRDESAAAADEWAEVPAKLSKKEKKRLEKLQRQSSESSEPVIVESPETLSFEDVTEMPQKLSKKEQKKRDKEARAQALMRDDEQPLEIERELDTSRDAGDDWEDGRKKSKKNRKSRDLEEDAASRVSVPIDAFEDIQSLRKVDPDDEWDAPKKSKKKSKRDSGAYESPSRSTAPSEVSTESSEKRSSKSKRRSGVDDDFDDHRGDPPDRPKAEPFEDREVSSVVSEARYDEKRREKRESRRSSRHEDDDTRSVASAPAGSREKRESRQSSRYDDDDMKSVASAPGGSREKRESTRSSRYDDDDTKSVASAPGGAREKRESKRSSRYDDDDTRSVASAPGGSREKRDSKRSSRYDDDDDTRSVASAPGGSRKSKDSKEPERRSSGLFSSIFKSGKDEKKESFLDNAGTPGAGVGLATAAAATLAAGLTRSNATEDSSDKERDSHDVAERLQDLEIVDPEIAPRAIKPAIDPQYGDLLPLPPSEPGTPKDAPEELPTLPDSRPDTPPEERNRKRDYFEHRRRRSIQDIVVKSPSSTAIPISLRLGQRGTPTTPGTSTFKSSPMGSPVGTPDSVSRRQARISWDSSREIKPLYLLEHSRHHSTDNFPLGTDLPALPLSEPSSRASPTPEFEDAESGDVFGSGISVESLADSGLRIDTNLARAAHDRDLGGSQETTPKAVARPELPPLPVPANDDQQNAYVEPDPVEPTSKDRSSYLLYSAPSSISSNKFADSEDIAQSSRDSTPSKKLSTDNVLHDLAEDLASADEHFSDAMEGPLEDTFEEARDWPADPIAHEPASHELLAENATIPATEEREPDEWNTMSAKDKKKAKKARKNKGLDLAETTMAVAAVGAAATVAASSFAEDSPKEQDVFSKQPEQPLHESEQPKKGKKGKKNKKQSLSWGDDLRETPSQPGTDEALTVAHTESPDATLVQDEPLTGKHELSSSKSMGDEAPFVAPKESAEEIATPDIVAAVKEVETTSTADPAPGSPCAIASDPPAEEETWQATSKKSKKKKKGKEFMSWDDTPDPGSEAQAVSEAIVADEPADVGQVEALKPASPPASVQSQEVQDELKAAPCLPETAIEANADEFWSTPASSKKDKKKKKKGKQAAAEWDEPSAPEQKPTTQVEPSIADELRDSSPREIMVSAHESPVTAEAEVAQDESDVAVLVSEPSTAVGPHDIWTAPATSKKDKKKRKKAMEFTAWDETQVPEAETSLHEEARIPVEPMNIGQDMPVHTLADAGEVTEHFTVVDPEDAWVQPATTKKDKRKKKQKAKDVMAWDEPQAETEQVAQEEAILADISPDVGQEGLTATTETEEAKDDPTTCVPPFQGMADVELEDTWSMAAPSKKDKKKKKRSLQQDEFLPAEDGTDRLPTPEKPLPVEMANEPALPAGADPEPFAEPLSAEPALAAAEPEFAPVAKGKKKKKDKRKSVQWEPDQDTGDRSLDVAAEDPLPSEFSHDQIHDSSALGPLPAFAPEVADSDLMPAQYDDKTGLDSVDENDEKPINIPLAPESSKTNEILDEDDKKPFVQSTDPPRALESHISEPLFSQSDAPIEPTQEASSLEPTQADEPASDMIIAGNEPTSEVASDNFAATKRKDKKNKKKSQASVWDLIEDESAPSADLGVETSAEGESGTMILDESAQNISETQPLSESQEAEAESQWNTPTSGKRSRKNKKSARMSFPDADQETVLEAPAETTEPSDTMVEPAMVEDSSTTVTTDQSVQDSAHPDEWPQATGKKGKKKKTRLSQMSSTWDEEPATSTSPVSTTRQEEAAVPIVDPETEFEVPKKGKKSKKKKQVLSWDSTDAETPPETPQDASLESQEPIEEALLPEEQVATDFDVSPQPVAGSTIDDAPAFLEYDEAKTDSGVAQDGDAPRIETDFENRSEALDLEPPRDLDAPNTAATEASLAEDSEYLFPIKMSKKDKKKKKQQTWLDELAPSTEGTTDSAALEEGVDATDEAGSERPFAASEQQPEATPDEEWGGFSLKKSKKDKKQKKAKDVEFQSPQEHEIASLPEPTQEATELAADQATDSSPNDNERGVDTSLHPSEKVSVTEMGTLAEDGLTTEDKATSQELDETQQDDWSLGLSKKDKKKKKKAKAPGAEADETSALTEATTLPEAPAASEETVEDDMWSGAISRKDKKKKKKAKLVSQDDFFTETVAPLEDSMDLQCSTITAEADNEAAVDVAPPPESLQDIEEQDVLPHGASGTTNDQPNAEAIVGDVINDVPAAEPVEAEAQREHGQVPEEVSDDPKHDQSPPADQIDDAEASTSKDPSPDDGWAVPLTGKKDKKGKKKQRSQVESVAWEDAAAERVAEPNEPSLEFPSIPAEEHTNEPPLADSEVTELKEGIEPALVPENFDMHDVGQTSRLPEDAFPALAGEAKQPEVADQQADWTNAEDGPMSVTQSQEDPSPEDNWEALPQRKLSKKDKKKMKKQESSTEDPTELATETAKEIETTPTPTPEPALADSLTAPEGEDEKLAFAQDTSQEPEEWLPTKKSKKDKKAKKLALAVAGLAAAGPAADFITTENDETREPSAIDEPSRSEPFRSWADEIETREPSAIDEPSRPEQLSSWADEMDDFVPIVRPETIPGEPELEPAQDDDNGLTFQMPTKKKKGKKGKSGLGAAEHRSESGPTSEPEPPAEHAAAEPRHAESGGEVDRIIHAAEPELTSHAPDIPETAAADDEWAMPIKKKGKKGKRGAASGMLTPANEPVIPTQSQPAPIESTGDHPEEAHSIEPAVELVPETEEPKPTEDNDTWAFETKKSKKGKKGKKGSGTATPAKEPDATAQLDLPEATREFVEEARSPEPSMELDPEAVSEPVPEPVPEPVLEPEAPASEEAETTLQPLEDDNSWALTTKKTKKGKKSKKGSGTTTPAKEPDATAQLDLPEPTRDFGEETRSLEPSMELVPESVPEAIPEAIPEPEAPKSEEAESNLQPVKDDNSWAFTTKKTKKGKKGKNGSGTTTPAKDPDAIAQLDLSELTRDVIEETQSFEPTMNLVPETVPEPEVSKSEEAETAPQPVEDDNSWAFTAKKTKKGKKGRKSSGTMTLANDPDVEAQPEFAESTQDAIEVTPSRDATMEPLADSEEPHLAAGEIPQAPEDDDAWTFKSKKSKKGKKGRSASGVVTPANEPEPLVESEPAESREMATETPDIEQAVETIVEQEAALHQEPQEFPQIIEATRDDDWEFTTKKKGKKGKKGKSGSGTMTPSTVFEDTPRSDTMTPTPALDEVSTAAEIHPDGDKDEKAPIVELADLAEPASTAASEAPRATWIQEPTPPVEAEDEWAMPVKKKKGKGKKTKVIPFSSFDEPSAQLPEGDTMQPETPQEPSSTDDQLGDSTNKEFGKIQPEEPVVTPDDNAETAVEAADEDKLRYFTETLESAEPEPIVVDEAPAPADANPDDFWGTPAKKKSKKDKKRKSSQVMILDSSPSDTPVLEETPVSSSHFPDQDTPMVDDGQEQHASDDWFDDFSVPKASSSVSKPKKKKKKSVELPGRAPVTSPPPKTRETREPPVAAVFPEPVQEQVEEVPYPEQPTHAGADAFDDVWESDPRLPGKGDMELDAPGPTGADAFDDVWGSDPRLPGQEGMDLDAPASTGADAFDDVWESDPRLPGKGSDQSTTSTEKDTSRSKQVQDELRESFGPSTAGTAAAGGVALLAEKFGGSKKKKKGKQKKTLDKRQPQEDIFDDPALWESADKKSLQTEVKTDVKASTGEGVLGGGEEGAEPSKAGEATRMLTGESLTESEGGWRETARHGAPLNDDDFSESPVLGRGEVTLERSEPAGLLRRGPEVEEPVGGLLREERNSPAMLGSLSPAVSEFRRSPTRALPAVEEVPEAEAEAAKYDWPTPEMNRDSGFAAESPNPRRRGSVPFGGEPQRDSGVHTGEGDWAERAPRTPEPATERRMRRSPHATPVLREPAAAQATPEPEKKAGREVKKSYGELAAAAAAGGGIAAASRQHHHHQARSASDGQQHPLEHPSQHTLQHPSQHPPQQHTLRAEPAPLAPRRAASNSSLARHGSRTPEPLGFRPDSPGSVTRPTPSPTPPLRRVDRRVSGDLRALRRQSSNTALAHDRDKDKHPPPSSSSPSPLPPPVANERRARAARDTHTDNDMADVYDGFGEGRIGSPRSPTRPHSMRRRQSMQVIELESRVEQLITENRLLSDARAHAEQNLSLSQRAATALPDRDAEIEALRQSLQFLQNEVTRLSEVNEGLTSANAELASKDKSRYADVSRELDEARSAANLTLEQKDAEIADLHAQLDAAKEQIRAMQRQILESKAGDSDFLTIHDEDYFDNRCQQLCSHVQQWVLRFSKFSDMRACRLTSEINDEKTIDRLDNAVLDGSDVDTYLNDRVKRRDIFMSMTMNMIWEFVFTRYLFGMDREQRQKLKSLEKLLTDVGPAQAVRQWRAVTLTLLSKRDSFTKQRELDTEAVVQAIFQTLCKILPPPGNLEGQIQSQLRRVMREAVDLSIEMRTQRAEYMMLPPLQPEYDADGELTATVQFDASMMNERSGSVSLTNEELESQGAVVRVVLFPLVVKRGDDSGVGEDKIIVCPAQVLIAREKGRRHVTPSSDAGGASLGAPSRISLVPETLGQPDAEYMDDAI